MVDGRGASVARVARYAGLVAALVGTTALIAVSVNEHYPIERWLFWAYARSWVLSTYMLLACAAAGSAALRRALREPLPWRERWMFAMASGVLIFFFGLFFFGLFGLFGPVFFYAWPLAMIGVGSWLERQWLRTRIQRVPGLWKRLRVPLRPVEWIATAFGMLGLAMVYFLVLTPDNIAYDSHWYHLPLAENYATAGRVTRFPEGWYQGTLPHLASFIYAWAFMQPWSTLFDRVELCSHLEFVIFLCTLFGIPVLVRWIAPRTRARTSWAVMFLFSGIFLYDSSLTTAADHIAAFWTVPVMVALRRAWTKLDVRFSALLGAMLAGSALTKYQTMSVLVVPTSAVAVRAAWLSFRGRSRRDVVAACSGLGVAAFASLALTAPHWLKNWVWYGDPVYPFLHKHLRLRPWTPDSANLFESYFKDLQLWRPKGTTSEQLAETSKAMFTFAFEPHDWTTFHGKVPVFGFLLTAALAVAPFVRPAKRLWAVLAACHAGVFVWYWASHQDRYLQILLPWMAAAAAGAMSLAWRTGRISKAAVLLLVALQAVWGGDVYFLPTHAMVNGSPIASAASLMSSGYRKDFKARESLGGDFAKVAARLPQRSKVLIHEMHMHLGIRAPTVNDFGPWQGGISYGRIPSPGALRAQFEGYGVTHFLWHPQKSENLDSLAGDFVFFEFASRYLDSLRRVGGFEIGRIPTSATSNRQWLEETAVVALCPGSYSLGVYRLGDLTIPVMGKHGPFPAPREPLTKGGIESAIKSASFVAYEGSCFPVSGDVLAPFTLLASRAQQKLMSRHDEAR